MMGRPRTPTSTLELKGAFKKDPARGEARQNEPVPAGPLGDPPEALTEAQKNCWREIAANAHKGVLAQADRFLVEISAVLLEKWRRGASNLGELIELGKCLGRMGLTPSDRSKVAATPTETSNPFDEIARPGAKVQ
jgi:hypothetical protein